MKHSLKSLLFLSLGAVLPLSAKLTAWYPLDESSLDVGTTTAELIAGNDATVPGFDADPALSSTLRGGPSALQSLGTAHVLNSGDNNLSAISLGSDSTVQPTDQFTFTCYFQPEAFNNFDRIFESLDGNGAALNGIRIDLGGQGDTVRFLVRDGSGGNDAVHPSYRLGK